MSDIDHGISGRKERAHRFRRLMLVLVALALLAAACGDSSEQTDPLADDEPLDVEADAAAGDSNEPEAADTAEDDFIDLPYFETAPLAGLGTGTSETGEECDEPEPGVRVCDFEQPLTLVGTHIGHASEVQTGTMTFYDNETCEDILGSEIPYSVQDGSGTITSSWGDDLYFRVRSVCGQFTWVVDGGTGRFEDATGLMSGVWPSPMPDTVATSVGTIRVRKALWEDFLPPEIS
ncbi:MAG TPA: hypothetical protein VMW08_16210 [Acidimicrobiales bacterium]|nr:hypothetical protein [Acidimicrobiales bacterium]